MPTTPLDLLPARPAEPDLTADCSRCFALCCVLLPYSRHEVPAYVTWATCCPAPKQSKTVQLGQPRSRRWAWIVQRSSSASCQQGTPPGLSAPKPAVRE